MLVWHRWSHGWMKFCQWSRKGSHAWKWGCTGKDHEIPCHTRQRVDGMYRLGVDEIVATVSSCQEQDNFDFHIWWENHCSVWRDFLSNKIDECCSQHVRRRIVSVHNCCNGQRLKPWHFLDHLVLVFSFFIYTICTLSLWWLTLACTCGGTSDRFSWLHTKIFKIEVCFLHSA